MPATRKCQSTDMVLVHKVFRRELGLLPTMMRNVETGDSARAAVVSAHCREMTTALRQHHGAEADLLVPKLQRRAPMDPALQRQMLEGHRTHLALLDELDGLLPLWDEAADPELGHLLADIVTELAAEVADHLDAIERWLLPLADEHITTAEWLQLGLRAAGWIPLTLVAVLLGALLEDATPQERQNLLAKVPGPARLMFRMVGREQYAREMLVLREGVLVAAWRAVRGPGAECSAGPLHVGTDAEPARDLRQTFVPGPQARLRGEQGGGQQLGIDVPDSRAVQRMRRDQVEDLVVGGKQGLRLVAQQVEDLVAIGQGAEREFSGHPGVDQHLALLE